MRRSACPARSGIQFSSPRLAARRTLCLALLLAVVLAPGTPGGALRAIPPGQPATAGAAGRWKPLTSDGWFKQRPAFSPDGRSLVFARHRGDSISLFERTLADGRERRLTEHKFAEYDAVFSPRGDQLLLALDKASPNQGDMEVYALDRESGKLRPLAVTQGKLSHEESPCWSPDGKQFAFTSTRDGNQELYVADISGENVRRLTTDPALDAHPSWSPDGKHLAFATNRWGDLEIATVPAAGGEIRRLTESPGLDDYPQWSPDGSRIAFTSHRDGNYEIYLMDPSGKRLINATANRAIDNFPAWTPDGQLGFVSNRDGGFEVYVGSPPE